MGKRLFDPVAGIIDLLIAAPRMMYGRANLSSPLSNFDGGNEALSGPKMCFAFIGCRFDHAENIGPDYLFPRLKGDQEPLLWR